ncbi:hypothetical protein IHO40_04835 [Wolbachia endosymbiont of Mansonella ozzardi]|uniref:hypothetical protein n=1 Tax=Wolbachia endosymbiont of Mansonella ozzardi TaxID=137464 RepID=UPI001CE0E48F|nr:hypothetical protein [Wolbachia endosymbiont of Mansonella ozzardi]MCA4775391.1 hypothetical protein [Wolbachia endosymbiont of Mansonella ozzardi]
MMKAKVNENDINIKNFRSGEKVKELDKDVESNLNKFEREIDKLETKVKSDGIKHQIKVLRLVSSYLRLQKE